MSDSEEVNRTCPPRNTTVYTNFNPLHDRELHNAQRDRQTDGQTTASYCMQSDRLKGHFTAHSIDAD